jgi:hypothetical protein
MPAGKRRVVAFLDWQAVAAGIDTTTMLFAEAPERRIARRIQREQLSRLFVEPYTAMRHRDDIVHRDACDSSSTGVRLRLNTSISGVSSAASSARTSRRTVSSDTRIAERRLDLVARLL